MGNTGGDTQSDVQLEYQEEIEVKVLTDKEWLIRFYNDWRKTLLDWTIKHEVGTRAVAADPQNNEAKALLAEAKIMTGRAHEFLKIIKLLMYTEQKEGSLDEFWKNVEIFKSKSGIVTPSSPGIVSPK